MRMEFSEISGIYIKEVRLAIQSKEPEKSFWEPVIRSLTVVVSNHPIAWPVSKLAFRPQSEAAFGPLDPAAPVPDSALEDDSFSDPGRGVPRLRGELLRRCQRMRSRQQRDKDRH